jgi:hypothetical protein
MPWDLIANIGFPAALCVYLLIEQKKNNTWMAKAIRQNTKSVDLLTLVVARITKQDIDELRRTYMPEEGKDS